MTRGIPQRFSQRQKSLEADSFSYGSVMDLRSRLICIGTIVLAGCSHGSLGSEATNPAQPVIPQVVQTGEQGNWIAFPLPSGQNAYEPYPGPDGAMWLVLNNAIGRMDI